MFIICSTHTANYIGAIRNGTFQLSICNYDIDLPFDIAVVDFDRVAYLILDAQFAASEFHRTWWHTFQQQCIL